MSSLQNGHHTTPGVESPALLESPIRSALLDHHRLPEEEVGDVAVGEGDGDSGEDSEEEWNYISGKDNRTKREQELKNTQELSSEDMEWQLNPNAAEFVPVFGADTTVARSPTKDSEQNLDDIQLPSVAEFCKKAASRPSDIEPMCNENETTLNGINLTGLSTKAVFGEDSIALNTTGNNSLLQDDDPALKETNPFCVRSPDFVPDHFASSDQPSKPFGVESPDSEFDIIHAEDVQPADSKELADSKDISGLVFGDGINLDKKKAKTETSGVQNGLAEDDSDLEDRPETPVDQIVTVHQEDTLSPFVTLRPSQGGPLVEEDQGFVGSEPDNASPAEEDEAEHCPPDELSEGKESLVCSEDELPQPNKISEPQAEDLVCPIKSDFPVSDFSNQIEKKQPEKEEELVCTLESRRPDELTEEKESLVDSEDELPQPSKTLEPQEEENRLCQIKPAECSVTEAFDQIEQKNAVKEEELLCTSGKPLEDFVCFEKEEIDFIHNKQSETASSLLETFAADSRGICLSPEKPLCEEPDSNLTGPLTPKNEPIEGDFRTEYESQFLNDVTEADATYANAPVLEKREEDSVFISGISDEKDNILEEHLLKKEEDVAEADVSSPILEKRDEENLLICDYNEEKHNAQVESILQKSEEVAEADATYAASPVLEKREEEIVLICGNNDEKYKIHEESLLQKSEEVAVAYATNAASSVLEEKGEEIVHIHGMTCDEFLLERGYDAKLSTEPSTVEEFVDDMISSPVQQEEVPSFSDEMSSSMIDHGTGTLEEKSLPEAQSNQLDLVQELAFEQAKLDEKPKETDTESDSGFEIINPSEASTIEQEESILAAAAASEKEAAAIDEKLLMDKNEAEIVNVNGVVTPPTTPAPGTPGPENKEGLIAAAVAAAGVATAVAAGAAAVAAVADKKAEDKKKPTTPTGVQKAAVGKPSQAKPGTKAPVVGKTGSKPTPGVAAKPGSKPATPTSKAAPAKTVTSPSKTAAKPPAKPATAAAPKPKPVPGAVAAAAKPTASKPAAPASSTVAKKPATSLTQRPTSATKTATSTAKPAAPKPVTKTVSNTTAAKPAAPRPPSATAKTATTTGSKPLSARPTSGGSKAPAPSKPAAAPTKPAPKPAAAKPTTAINAKTAAPAKPAGTKPSPGTKPPVPALKTSPATLNKRAAAPTAIKKPAPATDKSTKEANNKLTSGNKGLVKDDKKGVGRTQEPEVTTSTPQCILPPPLQNGTQIC